MGYGRAERKGRDCSWHAFLFVNFPENLFLVAAAVVPATLVGADSPAFDSVEVLYLP